MSAGLATGGDPAAWLGAGRKPPDAVYSEVGDAGSRLSRAMGWRSRRYSPPRSHLWQYSCCPLTRPMQGNVSHFAAFPVDAQDTERADRLLLPAALSGKFLEARVGLGGSDRGFHSQLWRLGRGPRSIRGADYSSRCSQRVGVEGVLGG